jgi:hypothetical protein
MGKTYVMGDIILDDEDKYLLKNHNWWFKDNVYPQTKINGKNVYIHHLVMNNNSLIDHIDRNPLNNKKSNLRFATKSTNAMNVKIRKDNTSGIKGVSWNKKKERWEVYINKNKNRIKLGYFKELKLAALERANAELKFFGEFANKELINKIFEKYG